MTAETKLKIVDSLTGLCALLAALGTLPTDSANLPMPENWRPYIISVGFGAAFLTRIVRIVITTLQPKE